MSFKIFVFRNVTCRSWTSIQNSLYKSARDYLRNKTYVLNESLIKSVGYKSCYHIDSLDASKCAEDCKKLESEEFGKNCSESGGLFKCCVRRDDKSCHECRFCCTLPMCTYEPGGRDNTIFDIDHDIELKDQKIQIKANHIFFNDHHIFKAGDYRCLKPESDEDPEKWHTYEVEGFRQAYNNEMLENTTTFKYDNYLYNFVDPKVFEAFTKNEKKGRKIWKKSYSFQYTRMAPGGGSTPYVSHNDSWTDFTKCIKKCIKMEKSSFAKNCVKDGGYFKCCVSGWLLSTFEKTRNKLIQDGLIEDEVSHICDRTSKKDPCIYCSTNGICTKRNNLNGKIEHLYPPVRTPKYKSK